VSEHSVTVLRFDGTSSAESEEITLGVQNLLLAGGVILPNDRRNALWQPSEWKPGPAARTAVVESIDWFDAFPDTANNGVEICGERDAYHPVETTRRRAACGARPQHHAATPTPMAAGWRSG
jgi:hypothetical protein